MIYFDHLKLARRKLTEVKRFRDWLLSASPGGELPGAALLHEHDGRCCRLESSGDTQRALVEAMRPATPVVLVNFHWTAL
jgi:hypothetical protein